MSESHGAVSGNTLTDLRAGVAVPEKAVFGLIEMLRTSKDAPPGAKEALFQFAADKAGAPASAATLEQIVEVVSEPSIQKRTFPTSFEVDHLERGVRDSWSLFALPGRTMLKRSRPCPANEVPEVVSWLYTYVAHWMASKEQRLAMNADNVKAIAARHMGIERDEYVRRALEWQARLPLTMRVAMGRRQPVGMTTVLPLNRDAYMAVRDGKRASYESGPADFVFPSRYLLIEGCAMRVELPNPEAVNPTLPMLASLILQLALLSAMHLDDDTPLHTLSFAGTPQDGRRLEKQRFRRTGAKMPRAGVAILERVVRNDKLADIDILTVALFRHLSKVVPVVQD